MKTAIALGTFDGLHTAHRKVLENTQGFYSIAVTFDIPPKATSSPRSQLLILPDDRVCRLKELGINEVVMQSFNGIKSIKAEDYLKKLKTAYNPARIVCGFNYRFGKGALGDTKLLDSFCRQNGIELIVVPPIKQNGDIVSSTAIRAQITNGEMAKASSAIYGGFKFAAPVLHGDARGRTLGFPTANQIYPELLVTPKLGVYISRVSIEGRRYSAITNVGFRPTFKTENITCETYIKDFSGDLYEKTLITELLSFVRPEQKFLSKDELKTAVLNDIRLLK